MYQVAAGNDLHEKETRKEAIVLAKELSTQLHRPVVVSDERETEQLTYREGELSKYQYEPRHRRR